MTTDTRADDPDMYIEDRVDFPMRSIRTPLQWPRGLYGGGLSIVINATRIDDLLDEVGHRQRQQFLFIGHGPGIVDGEQNIDFIDGALLQLGGHHIRRTGGRRSGTNRRVVATGHHYA